MDDNYEAPDFTNRDFGQVYNCLNGDGGPLCGSHIGMATKEVDAVILTEASKGIFSCVKSSKVWDFMIDNKDVDMNECVRERKVIMDNKWPDWIKFLEPIRRQPTNVGARIRNRVFKSLEKEPLEWAKEMLLRSINKYVYKGNAYCPTKVNVFQRVPVLSFFIPFIVVLFKLLSISQAMLLEEHSSYGNLKDLNLIPPPNKPMAHALTCNI